MTSCNGNLVTFLLPKNYHYPLFIDDQLALVSEWFVLPITFVTVFRWLCIIRADRRARDACARMRTSYTDAFVLPKIACQAIESARICWLSSYEGK